MAGTRRRKIHGVGINDADYLVIKWKEVTLDCGKVIKRREFSCPFYNKWADMLKRCYSEKYQARGISYRGCTVCEEWKHFSTFKAWMETQDWQGKELDKDLLKRGNKIYSPEYCVFLSSKVNTFLIERREYRGPWPIGVYWHKAESKFIAQINNPLDDTKEIIGRFRCPDEAYKAWLERKLFFAKGLAALERDERVAQALINRYINFEGL